MTLSRTGRFLSALGIAACLGAVVFSIEPPVAIPALHPLVTTAADGALTIRIGDGPTFTERIRTAAWTLAQLRGSPRGTATGIALDFNKPGFAGTLVFGLIPYDDTRYPQPVYRTTAAIVDGKAEIDIKNRLTGIYDMVGWAKRGRGVLGYRIIAADGTMLHDGRVAFKGQGPFEVDVTMIEGPFVANVTDREAVVWFELDRAAPCEVRVAPAASGRPAAARPGDERRAACRAGEAHQELTIDRLVPDTSYRYTVRYGEDAAPREEAYGFRTSPVPGARKPFVFGYASDSRGGAGGGERNMMGPNAHIMRRIMALAMDRHLAFLQFTGDLVSGITPRPDSLLAEFANWKRAVEPQGHWMPVYTGIGNHEAALREFADPANTLIRLPRFPFATESTEATFARALVNPANGPSSEDGAAYDPDPAATDFPPYRENVYSYVHDNVAVIVLNADYWWSPTVQQAPAASGNLHGYLMDEQVEWLGKQLDAFERSAAIDHVFVTVHTPVFPNGGHVGDDMWYRGRNEPRAWVAGKPVAKGIIERRDELLRLVETHPKVLTFLTGDEHNYNRTRLGPGVNIYPPDWKGARVPLRRVFYQVNNGAAGAPYYAQEQTPWTPHVQGFSTQNALCLFHVQGPHVRLEVINPETLEVIDRAVLR
jgi:hypothetical protein